MTTQAALLRAAAQGYVFGPTDPRLRAQEAHAIYRILRAISRRQQVPDAHVTLTPDEQRRIAAGEWVSITRPNRPALEEDAG